MTYVHFFWRCISRCSILATYASFMKSPRHRYRVWPTNARSTQGLSAESKRYWYTQRGITLIYLIHSYTVLLLIILKLIMKNKRFVKHFRYNFHFVLWILISLMLPFCSVNARGLKYCSYQLVTCICTFLYLFQILLKYYTAELKYSKVVGHKNAVYILLWKGMCIH